MALLLTIIIGCIAAIAIVAICVVLAAYLYLRYATRLCDENSHNTLFAIHLHEDIAVDWINHKNAKPFIEEFSKLGFTSGKAYTIEEMEDVKCLSFFHEKYVGLLYEVKKKQYYFDILHLRSESDALTVSTMPHVGEIHSPPGKEKIPMPGASVSEVFAKISEKSEGQPTVTIEPENFRELFETYYKEEQAYLNRNGGISFEEFKSLAEAESGEHKESQTRLAFINYKKQELENWNFAGLNEFFNNNELPDEELYSGGCSFIVPNKTDAESFVHFLNFYDMVQDEHTDKIGKSVRQETDILALFERINIARSPDLRAKEIGVISFPVEGRVYQMAS